MSNIKLASKQLVDLKREYTTRNGDRVVLHECKTHLPDGSILTFPLKGTVHLKNTVRTKRYKIWTLEGRASVLDFDPFDIVDLPPVLRTPPPPCTDCDGIRLTPPKSVSYIL